MSPKIWYYVRDGVQHGPVDSHEIHAMLTSGMMQTSDLIWRDGMEEWEPLKNHPEWQSFLTTKIPPASQPVGMPTYGYSGYATASLVCGISSIVLMSMCYIGILVAIPAVICGHIAVRQIRNAPSPMTGYGLAIAGLILGYLCITLTLAVVLLILVVFSMGLLAL